MLQRIKSWFAAKPNQRDFPLPGVSFYYGRLLFHGEMFTRPELAGRYVRLTEIGDEAGCAESDALMAKDAEWPEEKARAFECLKSLLSLAH